MNPIKLFIKISYDTKKDFISVRRRLLVFSLNPIAHFRNLKSLLFFIFRFLYCFGVVMSLLYVKNISMGFFLLRDEN